MDYLGLKINGSATGYVKVSGSANLVLTDIDGLVTAIREEYKIAKKERIAELEKRLADTKLVLDRLKAELDAIKK